MTFSSTQSTELEFINLWDVSYLAQEKEMTPLVSFSHVCTWKSSERLSRRLLWWNPKELWAKSQISGWPEEKTTLETSRAKVDEFQLCFVCRGKLCERPRIAPLGPNKTQFGWKNAVAAILADSTFLKLFCWWVVLPRRRGIDQIKSFHSLCAISSTYQRNNPFVQLVFRFSFIEKYKKILTIVKYPT